MIGIRGQVQREGEVVHIIAHHLADLSSELASVGQRGAGIVLSEETPADRIELAQVKNLATGYGHIDEIRVRTRDFR